MFFDTPVSRSWIHSLNTATFTRDTTIRNCGPAVREKKRHRERETERQREKDREREVEREETVSKVHILECLADLPPTYLIEIHQLHCLNFFSDTNKISIWPLCSYFTSSWSTWSHTKRNYY